MGLEMWYQQLPWSVVSLQHDDHDKGKESSVGHMQIIKLCVGIKLDLQQLLHCKILTLYLHTTADEIQLHPEDNLVVHPEKTKALFINLVAHCMYPDL